MSVRSWGSPTLASVISCIVCLKQGQLRISYPDLLVEMLYLPETGKNPGLRVVLKYLPGAGPFSYHGLRIQLQCLPGAEGLLTWPPCLAAVFARSQRSPNMASVLSRSVCQFQGVSYPSLRDVMLCQSEDGRLLPWPLC